MRISVATLLAMLLALSAARGDIVHLDDGTTLEGEVTEEGDTIRVRMGHTSVTVQRSRVLKIEKKKSPREIYHERAASAPNTADAHYQLALWCQKKKLYRDMRRELEKVIEIDTNHEGAHKRLGHVQVDGTWMTKDEAKRAQGWEKINGRWRRPAEVAKIKMVREAIARRKAVEGEISQIAQKLGSKDPAEAKAAFEKIIARGQAALTALHKLVRDRQQSPEVRKRSAEALAKLKDLSRQGGLALARAAVYDRKPEVRQAAAQAIRRIPSPHGMNSLLQIAIGNNAAAAARAAAALKIVDRPEPLIALINAIQPPVTRSNVTPGPTRTINAPLGNGLSGPIMLPSQTVTGVSTGTHHPAVEALKRITGEDHGYDKKAWIDWLRRHFSGKAGAPPPKKKKKRTLGGLLNLPGAQAP